MILQRERKYCYASEAINHTAKKIHTCETNRSPNIHSFAAYDIVPIINNFSNLNDLLIINTNHFKLRMNLHASLP